MSNRLLRILRAIEPHPGEHFKDKAIALGLAFVLWFVVNAEETVPEFFDSVPVTLENVPPDLAIAEDWTDRLSITVSGSQRDMTGLSSGRLSPTIDLSNAFAGENFFRLFPDDIPAPAGVVVQRINPDQVRIVLDTRAEKLVEISSVVSGEPAEGYEVVGRTTEPESVWLSGPSSLLQGIERITTQTVDVTGRRESFTQTVQLVAPNPFVTLLRERSARLTIEIRETMATAAFDGLAIEVIGSSYRVAINPEVIGVVLSGPPSILGDLRPANLRAIIDASNLPPRAEDYEVEPRVVFDPPALGDRIEVSYFTPQSFIDVHVYNSAPGPRP